MVRQYTSPQEAQQDQKYLEALKELIFQVADDDLLISHRGSEWLGLAPHIEEDVAFSSITQNTMGHAAMLYQLLEELGAGKADDLAHLRKPEEYVNAVLTERPNGKGHYKEDPDYDWGYAIIRNYAYEVFKSIRLEALANTNYAPLADTASKIKREQFYHLYHWEVWIDQLANSTDEAKKRLNEAIKKTWEDLSTLFDLGPNADAVVDLVLMESEDSLKQQTLAKMKEKFNQVGLDWPGEPSKPEETGREGKHSDEFLDALNELSEVYKLAPQASW